MEPQPEEELLITFSGTRCANHAQHTHSVGRRHPTVLLKEDIYLVGLGRVTFTSCSSQSDWFAQFCLGAESRICFAFEANKPLHIRIVVKTLGMINEEARKQPIRIANELYKMEVTMAASQAGSLRGPETFMLDLTDIGKHIMLGKQGTMPDKPLDLGTDLFDAPHVYLSSFDQKIQG